MVRLIIDIGNSAVKTALAVHGEIFSVERSQGHDYHYLDRIIVENNIKIAIISSVKHHNLEIYSFLSNRGVKVVEFTTFSPSPLQNSYSTPSTLGCDRLAAAIGAVDIYGKEANILIVDIGSAITIDMVCGGNYLGGNISPGADLRYRALNDYTDKLPLLSVGQMDDSMLFADNTIDAISVGVELGIVLELEGYIGRAEAKYGDIKIIFTGGGGKYFAEKIKNAIFVSSNLVIIGLNRVIDDIENSDKKH